MEGATFPPGKHNCFSGRQDQIAEGCGGQPRQRHDRLIVKGKTLAPIWNYDIYVTYKCCKKKVPQKETKGGKRERKMLPGLILNFILQLPDKQSSA